MKWQMELWRLFASVTCFGVAFAMLRVAWLVFMTEEDGTLLGLAIVPVLFLFAAGLGVLFRKAREWMLYVLVEVLRFIVS